MPISAHHHNPNCSNTDAYAANIKPGQRFIFFKKLFSSPMIFRKRPRHHHHANTKDDTHQSQLLKRVTSFRSAFTNDSKKRNNCTRNSSSSSSSEDSANSSNFSLPAFNKRLRTSPSADLVSRSLHAGVSRPLSYANLQQRSSVVWEDQRSNVVLPLRPFSADFSDYRYDNMQGCYYDDDFSANEIGNALPLGNNVCPGETTVSAAPYNEDNEPSQGFGLLRRLSRFGSAPNTKTPRRATSLLVSTHPSKATKQPDKTTLSRSMSLSEYYRRRFSSLIVTNNEFGNSMTRARSVFFRNKQERAVAIWKRSVAQLDLPTSSPILLPAIDVSASCKNDAMRAFILNELYATETSYYRLLKLIHTKYMQPMDAAMQNRDPLLVKKSGDIPILFGHLPQLLRVSQTLIQMLDQQMDVAHAFMALQDELTIFLRYAVHYKRYFKTIRRACQTNSLLLSIERECLARRESNRMGMSDYLIAPIQRVPRYCLLIQDLLKHTPTADPAYFELQTVFKMMTTLASVMNINDV